MKYLYTLLIILFSLPVFAQSGNVQGSITTTSGLPIPKATVKLLNTNLGSTTDDQGKYAISHLETGDYTISISALGYASQLKSFTIKKGQTLNLDFKLAESSQQLNEVTVSSEKRQESVQNIPAAITSLDAKQIRDYHLWDITNLTAIAPNLFVIEHGNSTSSNFFNIRGVMGFSSEQAVATYVDGVYQSDYFSAPPLFNDIQSIEVLRGPQGTLYGRNAYGGVVNITTRQPGNTPMGYAEATFGNYGQQRYTVGLSGPVIKDRLFASGSFTYNHRGSIYYNEFTHSGYDRREDYNGNFSLRYLPSANWSLALNAKTESDNDRGSFPWVTSIDDVFSKPYQVNSNNTNVERRNNLNTSLAANYYGKDFNFTSVSSYTNFHIWYEGPGVDYDFSPLDALSTAPDTRQQVYAQELRFSSPSASQSKLKWVGGAYGFMENLKVTTPTFYGPDYVQFDPASGAPFTTIDHSRGTNKGYAFFGQATYSLTGKLDFTAGIRYDVENRGLNDYSDYQKDPNPPVLLSPAHDYGATFHAVTPKFVLSYKLQDNMLLYGSYARGFRAGGLNTNAPTPAQVPYQPEHSDNYEIGWKNMLFNNKLKLNLTAFYLEQHNQQISTAMDGVNTLILNVGEMHNKGVELEVTALPVKGLQIDWNASYSHARYTSLLLYDATVGAVVNYKGDQPINTPPVTSMLAAQYTYDFSGSKQKLAAYVRGEYRYIDKFYFDFVNGLSQPACSLFNAKAGITTKNYELNFWARNIFDKKYVAYGSFGTFLLGAPETYGITLIAKF
ncbi:TonB-dependent receptor [Mucilaginibacter sp.]|uniref:TonB-dependent receptor n=1 Tax=Mucilaginibacter sp. TaxID=1882438 RepID=UPI00284D1612|nr:TonB-dependent receptor [Mucilaginibacter sp.]MDR3696184.1 TonB-dependent receptor [Mucilaginibacter sp.]